MSLMHCFSSATGSGAGLGFEGRLEGVAPDPDPASDLDRVLAEVYTGADCESVAPEGLAQVDWDQARARP